MRASRLVSTLLLLQTRGRMTAEEIATELEVSVRTVYRDVEALAMSGVPVYGTSGRDGGYALVDGYRSRLTGLAAPEAASLFLMGIPAAAADLGYGEALTAAQLKLMASLPDGVRATAERMGERFHLDAPSWYQDHDRPTHLGAVADAVWERRRATLDYERWTRPRRTRLTIDPIGLVLKAGLWYVVGRTSGGLRTFRVSRITSVTVLDESFEAPVGFDLAEYWRSHMTEFDGRRHTGTATLRMSPIAFEQIPHVLEPAVARAAAASACPSAPDGWVQVEVPTESLDHATATILRFGAEAEVVAPAALRSRVRREVERLAHLYR